MQDLAWTINKTTTNNNTTYKFYQEGSNSVRLYLKATNGNQDLRVGDANSSNDQFVLGNLGKLLKVTTATRFVGPYSSGSDWRTYNTENAGNYNGASLTFYVLQVTPAYTITAQSNNTNYGTVSLNGSVITGSPKSGYRYASPAYTVNPANSATVSQDGNAFTVTPSANTTVTINFEAIPSHTATFSINGATSTQDFLEGVTITFPSDPEDIDSKTFVGWATATIDETTNEAPSFVNTSSTTMGNSDVTYYAVFATATAGASAQTLTQTLQYDTWTYSGSTTNKSTYRLFGNNSYIQSASFDLSKLSKVKVWGGTFGGASYNSLTIGDGTNTWKSVTLTTSGDIGTDEFTDGTALTGTGNLRITSTCGDGSNNGLRIQKIEIYTMEPTYTYSAYCTTIVTSSVATPQFNPSTETFSTASLLVTLSCNTADATIRYTTNGEEPISSSTAYDEAISINATTTIKAKAFKGENVSALATKTYTRIYNVTLSSNGVAGDPIEVIAGQTTTLTAPTNIPFGYTFRGWTTTQSNPSELVSNTYEPNNNVTLYAVFSQNNYGDFIKVTSTPNNWSGYYLIVYIDNNSSIALNGSLGSDKIDFPNNGVSVSIDEDNGIYSIAKASGESYKLMFSSVTNGYSIKSPAGYYIGHTGSTNTLTTNTNESATGFTNTISIDNNSVATIKVGNTYQIKFNNDNTQKRFRYYTSGANVYLFKQELLSYTGYYTRVYPSNTTATADITINGPTVIESGSVLNMGSHTLSIAEGGTLIIEDGGQLITTNAVSATIKKNITAGVVESKGDAQYWYAISSPVNNAKIAGENANTNLITGTTTPNRYDLYRYYEAEARWENYQAHNGVGDDFLKLENGRGYLYRNESDLTITFTGTVNTSASYKVTADGPTGYTGFNLIGNPYTHEIYKGGAFPNSVASNYTLANGFYKLNPATGGWVPGTDNTTAIAPNEGFLVQATTSGTITIDNTVAKTRYNNEYLQFTVANSEYEDVAYALFDEGLGLSKINHRNADIPMLYINQDGKNYAIATMSDNAKSFNLNFKAMSTGKYTLSYKATGEYNYLHIIDRLTGADVDMLLEGEYSFIATPNDNENRFIVRLEYMPNYSEGNDKIFAFQNGNEILVSGEGELQIFDVTGRSVMTTTISGAESINLSAQGVYIFRLVGSEIQTQKIVVR